MRYDWNKSLDAGTIVCSNYNTFEGEQKVGLFLILYDEQNDNSLIDDKNVVALKISTKGTCIPNYSVPIDTQLNNFLDDNCIICCSKLHTLHKKQQIYKVLGRLHPATYHKAFKVFMKFNNALTSQLINSL